MMATVKVDYSAEQIKVLEGLEGVRRRPAMYIGSTGKEGLHHLVYEAVDNAIDEALAGFCTKIEASITKNGSVIVKDNGRGIPIEKHKQTKKSALETVMTMLHAGGKFDKKAYLISGGLHGVGISVVNALSKKLIVKVKRNNNIYQQEYSKGKTKTSLKIIGETQETGTEVEFWPDEEIFSTLKFDFEILKTRFRELSFLNPGLTITLEDQNKNKKEKFFSKEGIEEFVKWLNQTRTPLHKPIYFKKQDDGTFIEVAIQYNDSYIDNILGFVNTINTVEGGTHIIGFKTAITRVINDYAKKNNHLKNNISIGGNDVREGLTAIISIKIPEPQFEGQTKTKLGNSEIKGLVDSIVSLFLSEFFQENPKIAKKIIDKVSSAANARAAAKKARDLIRRKSALSISNLPGKLADCSSKKREQSELYIVEGDSAGGCFSGDTKVALADGRNLSFKNLVEEYKQGINNFCYTIKQNGSVGITKIENPRITKKNVQVIKIILDNNKEINCTPDHKFMLRDGLYKEAQNLTKRDSLMPFHRRVSKIGGRITIGGYDKNVLESVENYNHKIKKIEWLTEKIDVYDLEVEETHNFALDSGIFVHNSAKQARNKEFQAILPLKGKILNVEKANPHKIFSNNEIAALISAIGTGVGEQFNLEKLRYHKIIIMTDADVDGAHIKTLLLTFFFRYMKQLIEAGNVYVAVPPLYRIKKGQKVYYIYDDKELKKLKDKIGQSVSIQRFKGLGEMNPDQLWETTMNPKTRLLKKITIEDAALADNIFSTLMGDKVEPRRKFIENHAHDAELDV